MTLFNALFSNKLPRPARRPSNRRPRTRRNRAVPQLELLEDRLTPATHTWTGGSGIDLNWQTANNWTGGAPANGEIGPIILDFPSVASNLMATVDNIPGLNVDQINITASGYTFGASGATTMNLTGGINPAITDTVGGNSFNTPLTINLSATSVFQYNPATVTNLDVLNSTLVGPGGLTKTGNGELAVTNSGNSYAGQTTVNAGSFLVTADHTLGSPTAGTVVNSGGSFAIQTVDYTTPEPLTINGPGGTFAGAFDFLGSSTFAGNITVMSDSTIGCGGGALTLTGTVNSGGSPHNLEFFSGSGGESVTFQGAVGNTLALNSITEDPGLALMTFDQNVTLGTGTSTFNDNVALSGPLTFASSGPVTFGSSGSNTLTVSGSPTLDIASGQTITVNAATMLNSDLTIQDAGNISISGVVSGTGGLTMNDTGIMTLANAANTYTGVTTINSGLVSVNKLANGGSASGLGESSNAASNLVLNGGTLQYTGSGDSTDRLFSIGTSGGTIDSSGTGAVSFTNTGALGFNGQTGTRTLTLTGSNTGSNLLAALIGDNGGATSLVVSGNGTWILTANNAYTGTTTISGGILQVGNGGTTGSLGTGNVTDDTALVYDLSSLLTIGNVISGTGLVDINTGGVTQSGGSISVPELRLRGAGTFSLTQINAVSTFAANTAGANTFNDGTTALNISTITFGGVTTSGITTGNNDATISSGPLTISQAVNVGGANTVRLQSTGTVSQSASVGIVAGNLGVNAGGTVTLISFNNNVDTFAAIAPAGISFTDAVGFTTGQITSSTIFSATVNGVSTTANNGAINLTTGSGAVTVGGTNGNVSANGSGSVTLLANITTTSDVDINGTASSGTGAISVTAGRNIAFGAAGAVSTSTSAAGANVTLTASSTGTITEAGTNTAVTGNVLSLSAGGGIGSASNSFVMNGTTLTANSAASNGNQFLADSATVQLTTTNALNAGTGAITLTAGTFLIQSSAGGNVITDTSPLVVESPAVLNLNNNNETVTSLSDGGVTGGSVILGSGTLTTGNSTTSTTFSGVISGSGGLTKVGSDSFTLSGLNTYTGATNLNGGTLTVSGALNNTAAAAGGAVHLNTAGVTLNGAGTIFGQVGVLASTTANRTQVQDVTITVPTGGTGITVNTGVTFVQIGTISGVTVNGGNATSTGILVRGSALIENSNVSNHHVDVNVNGGTAAIQNTHMDTNFPSSNTTLVTGLLVQNGAIVDAGQLAASATPLPNGPAGNVGYYGDITGMFSGTPLGSTAHSTGGNTFNGYTLDTSATATPNPGPLFPQAIRDLNTGTAPFGALPNGVEQSFNYGAAGPQLGRMDVTAQADIFNGSSTLPLYEIEQLVFHDLDDPTVGFVTYGNTTAPAPVVVGNVEYTANYTLSALQGGESTLLAGGDSGTGAPNYMNGQKSVIRYVQVTFSSYVFLDPDLQSPTSNRGLNLIKVNGPYGAPAGTLIQANVVSAVYNRVTGAYTAVYSFSGAGTEFGSLEDGNYTLQFNEGAIQGGGPGGPGLSAAGDPFATTPASFFRLFGDANGDGQVDTTDLALMQAALRTRIGMAQYRAYFDFDGNGVVDSNDDYQFLRRYMTKLNPDGTISIIT